MKTKSKTKKIPESKIEIPLEVIDEKAIVNIKMSTTFFQRLQLVYLSLIKEKNAEEIQKFIEETKTQKISSEENYHIETLLILLTEFQKNAKAEGFTRIVSKEELDEIKQKNIDFEKTEVENQK
jgi:hypothetical protein